MAVDEKITALTAQTAPASADLLATVDVSDTTMAPTGTDKKITHVIFLGQLIPVLDVTDGETVVGYSRLIGANNVAGDAVTIIADGAGDVANGLYARVLVTPSAGAQDYGLPYCANNSSTELYNDGTDVLTLAAAADGSVTLQRTSGTTLTFDVLLDCFWS